AAVIIVVQVGAADAAGLDAHLDLVRPERRDRDRLDAQVLGGIQHGGAHGSPPGFLPAVYTAIVARARPNISGNAMNMFDLTGRIALVTGSSRGIGRAIAEGYAAAGARVLINGRDTGAVDAAVRTIDNAVAAPFDVTDKAVVEAAVERIEREIGPIDILVNNA